MTNNDTTSYTLDALAMCRRELQKRLDKIIRELAACSGAEQAVRNKLYTTKDGKLTPEDHATPQPPAPPAQLMKGCPFCGHYPYKNMQANGHTTLLCANSHCAATVSVEGNTEAHAAERWNTRTIDL